LLGEPPSSVAASALAEEDLADLGFVTNVTKLWMHDPAAFDELFTLITSTACSAGLSLVDRGVATIVAAALTRDSYCPLAWGGKVAEEASPELAASLVSGSDELLDERGRAIAAWARLIATEPRSAGAEDLENLLRAGFDRAQILRLTLFITMRIAFATVSGALAAPPEQEYVDLVHPRVREAWQAAFGRIGRAERTPR
jgi:alkylhydroperoxidase family enzyme